MINIFCGFHQIVIWTQPRVLLGGQFRHTALLHNDAFMCVWDCLCVLASCWTTWSFLSILLNSVLQTPAGVTDRCCLLVSLTQGANTGLGGGCPPAQSRPDQTWLDRRTDGNSWNMSWRISGNTFKRSNLSSVKSGRCYTWDHQMLECFFDIVLH